MKIKELINQAKIFFTPLSWLFAVCFLIEEAIWDWTAKKMAQLGAFAIVAAVERNIASLPPYPSLIIFCLPSTILLPVHYLEYEAFSSGHWFYGILILIVAKLIGVALFARIFNLIRPKVMMISWFFYIYTYIMDYRNKIHAYLDNWEAYQSIKSCIRLIMIYISSYFS